MKIYQKTEKKNNFKNFAYTKILTSVKKYGKIEQYLLNAVKKRKGIGINLQIIGLPTSETAHRSYPTDTIYNI